MANVLEVHKAVVAPSKAEALVALRPRLIEAVRRAVPGFVGATLVRVDERTWLDVVEFESAEAAAGAAEIEMGLPEAQEMMALIDGLVSADAGEIADRR